MKYQLWYPKLKKKVENEKRKFSAITEMKSFLKQLLIFAGTNFRESKINAFHGYLFSQINFLQISLFYTDFDGISEKSTFRGSSAKFAKLSKISTIRKIQTYYNKNINFKPIGYIKKRKKQLNKGETIF